MLQSIIGAGRVCQVCLVPSPVSLLPKHLCTRRDLCLHVSLAVVPDLRVCAHGFSGTFYFRGIPHFCIVPWGQVYAMSDGVTGRGQVWVDVMPKPLVQLAADSAHPSVRSIRQPPKVRDTGYRVRPAHTADRSHLQLVR